MMIKNWGLSENETRELKGLEPDDEVKYIILIEELMKNADEFKLGLGIEPDSIQPIFIRAVIGKT